MSLMTFVNGQAVPVSSLNSSQQAIALATPGATVTAAQIAQTEENNNAQNVVNSILAGTSNIVAQANATVAAQTAAQAPPSTLSEYEGFFTGLGLQAASETNSVIQNNLIGKDANAVGAAIGGVVTGNLGQAGNAVGQIVTNAQTTTGQAEAVTLQEEGLSTSQAEGIIGSQGFLGSAGQTAAQSVLNPSAVVAPASFGSGGVILLLVLALGAVVLVVHS